MTLASYLPNDWNMFLGTNELEKIKVILSANVFPAQDFIFRAFELCRVEDVRVIILGQDPYHTPGQANGLAFSCETSGVLQPSLRNILKEVERSMGQDIRNPDIECGNLKPWADQGVLLLNTVLTVESGRPQSHRGLGWEEFTGHVVYKLLSEKKHLVFMRWGKEAKALQIPPGAEENHLILTASHPSPFSARISFEGCNHFMMCNKYQQQHGQEPIQWT
jgi:uracil-DNA glycosylase